MWKYTANCEEYREGTWAQEGPTGWPGWAGVPAATCQGLAKQRALCHINPAHPYDQKQAQQAE